MTRAWFGAAAVLVTAGLLWAGSPAAVAQPPDLQGRIQLVTFDGAHDSVQVPYLSRNGTLYRLEGSNLHLRNGQQVAVNGKLHDRVVEVDRVRPTATAPAPTPAHAPASINALVELVTWTTPDNVTPADAEQQLGTTSAAWFDRESYGALSVRAHATRWLTIAKPADTDGDGPATPCDNISAIQSSADQAAATAGYQASDYTNTVYYYPGCPDERWGGVGDEPGRHTWLIGELSTRTTVHELGHNLGLGHSHSDVCTSGDATVPYSTSCELDEYGDPISAMGAGFSGQGMYAANQQSLLGWLGSGSHLVRDAAAAGSYRLDPLERRAGGTQALRVGDRAGHRFWIEYRQPTGNDSFLGDGATHGVLIRSGSEDSNLYDMTTRTPEDFTDAALAPGSSWSSPSGGLTVTVTSTTSGSATVALGPPAPARPGRPAIGKASSGSRSDHGVSVTARWKAPTSGGKVAHYYVTAVRTWNGTKKTVVVSAKARSLKMTGLVKTAHYRVHVTASNVTGKGRTSKSSAVVRAY